jgi:hypothetical protein
MPAFFWYGGVYMEFGSYFEYIWSSAPILLVYMELGSHFVSARTNK